MSAEQPPLHIRIQAETNLQPHLYHLIKTGSIVIIKRQKSVQQGVQQNSKAPHISLWADVRSTLNKFCKTKIEPNSKMNFNETSNSYQELHKLENHSRFLEDPLCPICAEKSVIMFYAKNYCLVTSGSATKPKSINLMFESSSNNKFS